MQYSILIVEDQEEIRQTILKYLTHEGYQVYSAKDGEEGLDILNNNVIDVILLDLMLPGIQGEEVIKKIRLVNDVPIVVISAMADEETQKEIFDAKIDDYVIKPFSMNVLTYKIAAIIRRSYGEQFKELNYKGVKLIVNNYEVYYQNKPIDLTAKEFELLQAMLRNKGKFYSREELISVIWGYDYLGDSRTIDVHVKNIRKKLFSEIISTIKGAGYRIERE
ncbi:response regulator transcription factor [Carnobacterium divergens]|uniref:Response regulator transcription factor n=1 Tax=Carnobacterium divergens TaxID=2748 RepID=A0AAW8RB31_CARDV|nr:response regulator transcription factor [Carnobacterium divergens]MDT1959008.1 response regulator transcription factor [Carnobacterium divergens]MDT1974976.1 response regulator transcription factor [Carnobacterium divergens]MDT2012940.1 response regulator transcription factor [Carnobacterium divergens]